MFFVLGVAHGDPSFAQVSWLGKKIVIFRGFQQNFFRTTGFQLKFLILIEFRKYFVGNQQKKKIKLGVV